MVNDLDMWLVCAFSALFVLDLDRNSGREIVFAGASRFWSVGKFSISENTISIFDYASYH